MLRHAMSRVPGTRLFSMSVPCCYPLPSSSGSKRASLSSSGSSSSSSSSFDSTVATPRPAYQDPLGTIANTMRDQEDRVAESIRTEKVLSRFRNQTVVSPSQLDPERLLQPYPTRPNLTLAYPLGPPRSESQLDPLLRLNLSPLASPMNPYLRAEFCTVMGKIKSRGESHLQRSSQRKMGKAVRRARAMGIQSPFGRTVPGSGSDNF